MAENKKYFWLKLKEDFFRQKEIKKLRRIAGGDTFTIIYLKMQLLSIKNNGVIVFEGIENDLAEQLCLELDEDIENIRMTLAFLHSNNLIEQLDNEYLLNKVPESIGKESQSAERVRKFRAKQSEKTLQCNVTSLQSNTQVTKCNTEIEIEIDIELDNKKSKDFYVITDDEVIRLWNSLNLKQLVKISDDRRKLLNARLKEYGKDNFLKAIELIRQSHYLNGQNPKGWFITFDWFIKPRNFLKVLENTYENRNQGKGEQYENRGLSNSSRYGTTMEKEVREAQGGHNQTKKWNINLDTRPPADFSDDEVI